MAEIREFPEITTIESRVVTGTGHSEVLKDRPQQKVTVLKTKGDLDGGEKERPDKIVFEKPTIQVSQHLKPLYIKAHIDGLPVDRVLVDGGSAINVMPQMMLRIL